MRTALWLDAWRGRLSLGFELQQPSHRGRNRSAAPVLRRMRNGSPATPGETTQQGSAAGKRQMASAAPEGGQLRIVERAIRLERVASHFASRMQKGAVAEGD